MPWRSQLPEIISFTTTVPLTNSNERGFYMQYERPALPLFWPLHWPGFDKSETTLKF